jgi:large subunit ribosomal protein L21
MYAVVEIGGKQYRIVKDMKLKIPFINAEPGKKVAFNRILMVADEGGNITLGNPVIKDQQVDATILEHGREKKIIIFKKKRRKGYQKKVGHRQHFTMIEINDIKSVKSKIVTEAKKEMIEVSKAKQKAAEKKPPKQKVKKETVKQVRKTKTVSKKSTGIKKVMEKTKSTADKAAKKTPTKSKTKAAAKGKKS